MTTGAGQVYGARRRSGSRVLLAHGVGSQELFVPRVGWLRPGDMRPKAVTCHAGYHVMRRREQAVSAAVLRIKRRPPGFVQVMNETVRDPRLSFRAVGVLALVLSLPEGEPIDARSIAAFKDDDVTGCGRDAVRSAFAELEEAGYMRRSKEQGPDGRWRQIVEVAEHPSVWDDATSPGPENPSPVEPSPGPEKPAPVNQALFLSYTDLEEQHPDSAEFLALAGVDAIAAHGVLVVFTAWQESTGRKRAKLTRERRRKIEGRFRDGYTVGDLIDAVNGWKHSPFHRGENDSGQKWNELDLLLRSGTHVERFANLTRRARRTDAVESGDWMKRTLPPS